MSGGLLSVEGLEIAYRVRGRELRVLREVSFEVAPAEAYGLVGESGSGKSTVALAIARYLPDNGRVLRGRVSVHGEDVFALPAEDLRRLRATTVSMVYQDPGRALNPSIRVGEQIAEVYRLQGLKAAEARESAADMLQRMQIDAARSVYERYAHQLSGGMQQRVAIGMALAARPRLLVLDEPTTGLDATVEAEILDLLARLRSELAMSILFISHNLAVIEQVCGRVGVLYAGRLIEEGPTAEVFRDPRHPYTAGLMRCVPRRGWRKNDGRLDSIPGDPPAAGEELPGCAFAPRCGLAESRCTREHPEPARLGARLSRCHFPARAAGTAWQQAGSAVMPPTVDRAQPPLLDLTGLSKSFGSAGHSVRALQAVSLQLWPGETLALVGESGSGKSTLARVLLGLIAPDPGGVVTLEGAELAPHARARRNSERKCLQIVFQNPDSALNAAHSVRRLLGRVLARLGGVPKALRARRLLDLLRSVRLDERHLALKPRQLSGGLKQRVAIARAFAGDPRVVVCDEPTSALDVSIQAQVLDLLADLQASRGVSYLFISHDLGVVRYLADRIAVLYLGQVMESGPADRIFSGPHHPYTAALLSAVPDSSSMPGRVRLRGEAAGTPRAAAGCPFHPRCPRRLGSLCETQEPPLNVDAELGHAIRCHIPASEL